MKKTTNLKLYAGPKALQSINKNGLTPQSIKVIAGASGGPKWFILNGLDRYIFGEWLKDINHSIHLIGSSAGSWRFSCFAQQDSMRAYDRMEEAYRDQRYPENPSPLYVRQQAEIILNHILGDNGCQQIISNKHLHTNIMAVRSKPFTRTDKKYALMAGLSVTFLANLAHRRSLGFFYERAFFHAPNEKPPFFELTDFPTQHIKLTHENIKKALLASGAIPMVIAPVTHIPGASPGIYRDGGMLDYNFDIPFLNQEGIVLYPHFMTRLAPGWFDKPLKWRSPNKNHLDNVLLLCPSDEFVATLRYQKIPDRNDFKQLNDEDRISFWKSVAHESQRLGEEFSDLISRENVGDFIEPI